MTSCTLNMEEFIEKVRSYECLWDTNSLLYRNVGQKDQIWDCVAKECGLENAKEAKVQWKRLRDCHREALRRRKAPAGQTASLIKPWKYEQLMDFLLPYITNRDTTNNDNDAEHIHIPIQPSDITEDPNDNNLTVQIEACSPANLQQPKHNNLRVIDQKDRRRRHRDFERHERRITAQRRQDSSTPDALSDFFSSMCKKTRSLPRHVQISLQKEIFNTVIRAEEEVLNYEGSPNSGYRYNYLASPVGSMGSVNSLDEEQTEIKRERDLL